MKTDAVRLLGPLRRAVRADKPIPATWREPLVELLELMLSDRDRYTAARAARVIVEMVAADKRRERLERKTAAATAPGVAR